MRWRKRALLVALLSCVGCADRSADLRARIPVECRTIGGCERLEAEAALQAKPCVDGTSSSPYCVDHIENLMEIQRRRPALDVDALRRAREREAADLARYQAEREASREAVLRERREAEEARRAAAAIAEWVASAPRRCDLQISRAGCAEPPPGATEADRTACASGCSPAVDEALARAYKSAVSDCASDLVDRYQEKAARPQCLFGLPAGTTETLDGRRAECEKECVEKAKPRIKRERDEETRSRSSRVRCCDGTNSPTCECPGHQGCCSHHRGVCGCAN